MEEGRRKSFAAAYLMKEEGRGKMEEVPTPTTISFILILFIFFIYCFLI